MRVKGHLAFTILSLLAFSPIATSGKQIDAETGENKSAGTFAAASATAGAGVENGDFILKTESKPIPFKTRYELNRNVGRGRIISVSAGKAGELKTTIRVTMKNGKAIKREVVETERTEPVDAVFHVGHAGFSASRGAFTRASVLTMHASAYDPSAGRGSRATFRTATGQRAKFGVVAVDPRVIPLGTMVFVEGYGLALACDTGSAIKGNRIDLCMNTYREAIQFGRRTVRVHILK